MKDKGETLGEAPSASPDYSRRIAATGQAAEPDFSLEWAQISEGLKNEAACALQIGLNLIRIMDELKPRRVWLAALREHGMSQPQASRYIRFAKMPERDREPFQRVNGFSLSAAIGEARSKAVAVKEGAALAGDVLVPEGERARRDAEVARRLKLAIAMVECGEVAMGRELPPGEEEVEQWRETLDEVAAEVYALIEERLEARLRERLLPGPGA